MKTILLTITVLATTLAFAQEKSASKIQPTDEAIYFAPVQLGSVQADMPNCPAGAMCDPASVAKLVISLDGCLDRVVNVATQVRSNGEGKIVISVAAAAARNKKSANVKCVVQQTETVSVTLGLGFLSADNVIVNDISSQ